MQKKTHPKRKNKKSTSSPTQRIAIMVIFGAVVIFIAYQQGYLGRSVQQTDSSQNHQRQVTAPSKPTPSKVNKKEVTDQQPSSNSNSAQIIFKKIANASSRIELLKVLAKYPEAQAGVADYISKNVQNEKIIKLIFTQLPHFIKYLPETYRYKSLLLEDLFRNFYKAQDYLPPRMLELSEIKDGIERYKRKQYKILAQNKKEFLQELSTIPCCKEEALRLLHLTLEQFPNELFLDSEILNKLYATGFSDQKLALLLSEKITQPTYQLVKYFVAKKIAQPEFKVPSNVEQHALYAPTLKEEQGKHSKLE